MKTKNWVEYSEEMVVETIEKNKDLFVSLRKKGASQFAQAQTLYSLLDSTYTTTVMRIAQDARLGLLDESYGNDFYDFKRMERFKNSEIKELKEALSGKFDEEIVETMVKVFEKKYNSNIVKTSRKEASKLFSRIANRKLMDIR